MKIKMCGMTNIPDALYAAELGVDAIGLIFASFSKRYVRPETARDISLALGVFPARVGVFVDAPLDKVLRTADTARLTAVQLHGNETPEDTQKIAQYYPVLRALKASAYSSEWQSFEVLLDAAQAGSGKTFDWHSIKLLPQRWWLAGGLGLHNVAEALQAFAEHLPVGVDAVTHLEQSAGIKNHSTMHSFVQMVRSW